MPSLETDLLSTAWVWIVTALPRTVAALAIVAFGFWASRLCERLVRRGLETELGVDPTLRGVLASSLRYAILLLCLVAAIGELGFEMSSIFAVLATAGLAVGLALQATLANIAAGIMLLWLRPFKIGEQIEVGTVAGRVAELGLFASEIHTVDGLFQFVPNSELWNKRLVNYSRLPSRLLSVRTRVADVATIERLRAWVDGELAADSRVLAEPKPSVTVVDLAGDRMIVAVNAWVATQSYAAMTKAVSDRLPALVWPPPQTD